MRSVSVARRASATVAVAAPVAIFAVTWLALAERPLVMFAAIGCEIVAIAAAASTLTRPVLRTMVAGLLALALPLFLLGTISRLLEMLVVIALAATTLIAARYALEPHISSLRGGPIPGVEVGRAARPFLIVNPRSGGRKAERFGLVEQARRRSIEPIVMDPHDDLARLARDAVADGADVIGVAGGDGSQAAVAGVAMQHDIAFVCVPAGTRNHFAMDLGIDRNDVVGGLDAFGEARERRIDMGTVGGRPFVNNASMGLYAKAVQSPQYRDRTIGTVLEMLPTVLGRDAARFDLQFTLPDGTAQPTAHLILVSNNPYEMGRAEGFGSRRCIDRGVLGIVTASFKSSEDIAGLVPTRSTRRPHHFPGWHQWTDTTFHVRSGGPVELSVDGEAIVLPPPIEFRILSNALRLRIPRHSLGLSPAATARASRRAAIDALLRTAAGRHATIKM
jgi:diacylglycerol kinase family enzyme